MRRRNGLTLVELLVVIVVLGGALFFTMRVLQNDREASRRRACARNLKKLARGMGVYFEWGDNRFYTCPLGRGRDPSDYNGAEWIASLYWTGVVPDEDVFLCPASDDSNGDGVHLGYTRTTSDFGSQTVSYAGMHWRSVSSAGGGIRDDFPPNEAMASDDTEGTINHGTGRSGGMNVIFFDVHVEWKTADELDPRITVGQKGGLLARLRN